MYNPSWLWRHNQMCQRHCGRYLRSKDERTLRELSPFVWYGSTTPGFAVTEMSCFAFVAALSMLRRYLTGVASRL